MTGITGALRQMMARLRHREDSEHEQALIRVSLVAGVCVYFQLAGGGMAARDSTLMTLTLGFYEAFSVAYVIWIIARPASNRLRRILSMATDFAAISLGMHFGGEVGAPLYPLYLWVILGNGFRYGLDYLFYSSAMAALGFCGVWITTLPWRDHDLLTLGLLSGLAMIPGYAATLIRKLTEAKCQAEAASLAKSRFLAIVSHELRTPLNAIIGMSDLMFNTRLNDEQTDMARTIHLSGKSLLSLIDTVLDFSRIEAGKTTVNLVETDLYQSLAELVAVLRPQAIEKSLRFSIVLAADVPARLRADWQHVQQILTNLIANAIKFTQTGGIILRVTRGQDDRTDRLLFEIEDTGIGIPADKLRHIFDSFAQGDDEVNRRYGGSGLGLTISLQLAELMGGTVSVESEVGVGSLFRFALPLDPLPDQSSVPLPLTVVAYGHRLTLPRTITAMVTKLLVPRDAEEALALLKAATINEPALLLLDEITGQDSDLAAAAQLLDLPVILAGQTVEMQPPALVQLPANAESAAWLNALRAGLIFARRGCDTIHSLATNAHRSLKVVVAEDNRVNIKVVSKILESAGHQIEVVGDGDRLLEAMETDGFDIVIADVNMPGTPLTDLVKLFRMANLDRARLPIIALSADATQETRRACEAAGVDVYLTKPVVAAALLQTIERLTPGQQSDLSFSSSKVADLTRHPGFSGPTASPVDWTAIDALLTLGDREMVGELTQDFIEDAGDLIDGMEEAVVTGDSGRFRADCHALRSSAANVGARTVTRLCQANAGGAADLGKDGSAFCARLRAEILLYRQEMERFLGPQLTSTRRLL